MAGVVTPAARSSSGRLEATYVPERHGPGSIEVRLVNTGPTPWPEPQVAFDSVVQLDPAEGAAASLVERVAGHHVLAPPAGTVVGPGEVWSSGPLRCGHRPGHANDGPTGAYLLVPGGEPVPLRTPPTRRAGGDHAWRPGVPGLRLAAEADDPRVRAAWAVAVSVELRLEAGPAVLGDDEGRTVRAQIDDARAADEYDVTFDGDDVAVHAGSPVALQWALLSLARAVRARTALPAGRWTPRHPWRGMHLDLARQFFPADDVATFIALAAARRCNRVHLHLTDDESWRLRVPAVPALTDVGSWRGHGRAIPPLLGSGPAPLGGSYGAGEIDGWVAMAATLGIELVPEIDLPGHCAAALAALPDLRDPDDTSGARSIQHFVDNTLNPGVPRTWEVLGAVFEEVAARFGGGWLHVGGDEVAPGSWAGSPAAHRWAAAQGIPADTAAVERRFMAEIVALARRTTGGRVAVWQEAADAGAVAPGAATVVGWKSLADCRRLAAAGHDVVLAPAERYYLDIAASAAWTEPGTHWAGHTSLADLDGYDPTAAWTPGERARVAGAQACAWTEHAPDWPSLERLLLPRLDAITDAWWTVTPN